MANLDPAPRKPTNDPSQRRWARLLAPVGLLATAIALFAVAAFVLPPLMISSRSVPDAVKRLELQNAARLTLLQGLGAAFLVAGAYLTWRQLELNRMQVAYTLEASTIQLQLSREGQLDDMFGRALESLGHEKVGVRVGAIYALEQLARTSDRLRPGIHELLAAYVRAAAHWPHHDPVTLIAQDPSGKPPGEDVPLLKIRAADVQAAVTALGRRVELPNEIVELQSVDLRQCYLGGASLRRAHISRSMVALADLSGADLSGSWLRRTNFCGAVFHGANLRDAVLRDTVLLSADFSEADLSGADLRDAVFDDATRWPDGFDWTKTGAVKVA